MRLATTLVLLVTLTGCGWIKSKLDQQAQKAKEKATEAAKNALAEAQKKVEASQAANTNVERKEAPTPEVRAAAPRAISTGQTIDVVLTGAFADVSNVTAGEICHVKQWKATSPGEIRLTLTADDKAGDCPVTVQAGGRSTNIYMEVQASAAAKAQQEKDAQQQEKEAQQQAREQLDAMQKEARERSDAIGSKWAVKLPNGVADEWQRYETLPGGIGRFKSAQTGMTFMITAGHEGTVLVQSDDGTCTFNGLLDNGRVSGNSLQLRCRLGRGAYSANISK